MVILPQSKEAKATGLAQLLLGNTGNDSDTFNRMLQSLTLGTENAAQSLIADADSVSGTLLPGVESAAEVGQALSVLLKGDDAAQTLAALPAAANGEDAILSDEDVEALWLDAKLGQTFMPKEVKALIAEAKSFLKQQISERSEVQELPKTLSGLVKLAEKVGVEVKTITLETVVQQNPSSELAQRVSALPQAQRTLLAAMPLKLAEAAPTTATHTTEELVQTKTQLKPGETKSATPSTLQNLLSAEADDTPETAVRASQNTQSTDDAGDLPAAMRTQTASAAANQSTAQTQVAQAVTTEPSEETGETKLFTQTVQTRIDAETGETELVKTERNAQNEVVSETKSVQGGVGVKEQALEVKVKEAQQMVRHFATELKEAVENYKPPFTRLKIQLNPQRFGEVDVTMVQRGNNVHINISSNATAIATLAQNAQELKAQLANNGLSQSTMQFNTSGGEQQRQEQNRQYAEQMLEQYERFNNEESYETISSIELIVPRYV